MLGEQPDERQYRQEDTTCSRNFDELHAHRQTNSRVSQPDGFEQSHCQDKLLAHVFKVFKEYALLFSIPQATMTKKKAKVC